MAKHVLKKKKRRGSPLGRLLRGLYGTVVVLSAIIVVTFCAFKVLVRPPVQAAPPVSTAAPVQSDNPDTAEDESLSTPPPPPERRDQVYTFLLAAGDYGGGNADTIMVVRYDVPKGEVGVVSIMRDTMTKKYPKINGAYAKGPEALREAVSHLTGIPIDYYITVNMKAFKALVNAVDGLDFYIPCDMNYDDTTPGQELRVHYSEGMRHLNGSEALEVARFRHNNDGSGYTDVGRAKTQRNMLTAIAKKVFSLYGATKMPQYIDIFSKYVKTDITLTDMTYFATSALGVDTKNGVKMTSLPGDGDVTYQGVTWCYQLYPEESLAIFNEYLNPYTTPITAEMAHIFQP